jgi:hypothetical protein
MKKATTHAGRQEEQAAAAARSGLGGSKVLRSPTRPPARGSVTQQLGGHGQALRLAPPPPRRPEPPQEKRQPSGKKPGTQQEAGRGTATSSAAAAASGKKGAAAADQASRATAGRGHPQITLKTRDEVEWLQNAQKVAEKRARSPRRGRGQQQKDDWERRWWHSEGDKHQEKPDNTKAEASQGRGKSEASRGRSARRSPRSRSRPLSVQNRAADDYMGGGWWRVQKPADDDIQDKGAGQELQGDQQGEEMKWGREAYPPSEPSEQLPT